MKKFKLGLALLGGIFSTSQLQATNWIMLQGTEPAGQSARAKVWGFIQPEYQSTTGTKLNAGPAAGTVPIFNQIGPSLDTNKTFQIRRARLGVRGTGFPLDSRVNYFFLAEFGNNAITKWGSDSPKISDASITLNYFPGARIRIGLFKTPSGEEMIQGIGVQNYINFTNFANQQLNERFFTGDGIGTGSENYEPNAAGAFRDVGVQVFDSFRIGEWDHTYAIMIGNGHGISLSDNDSNKDLYLKWSSERVFGNSKGPRRKGLNLFGWLQNGKRTLTTGSSIGEFDRKRWGLGATYNDGKWRAAAEYYKADGMIYDGSAGGSNPGKTGVAATLNHRLAVKDSADGWYADAGYRVLPNLELDIRYDILNRTTDLSSKEEIFETTTLGAQYFFNKKTRVTVNYEFRQAEGGSGNTAATNVLSVMDDRFSVQLLALF